MLWARASDPRRAALDLPLWLQVATSGTLPADSDRVGQSFYEDRAAGLTLFASKRFRVTGGRLEEL